MIFVYGVCLILALQSYVVLSFMKARKGANFLHLHSVLKKALQSGANENGGGDSDKKAAANNYLNPTNPFDGRPGVRSSTNKKTAGKSSGNKYTNVSINFVTKPGGEKSGYDSPIENRQKTPQRFRASEGMYMSRVSRLDSAAASNSRAFVDMLSRRTDSTTQAFDSNERNELNVLLDKYLHLMNARETAILISCLGSFSICNMNWRQSTIQNKGNDNNEKLSQTGQIRTHLNIIANDLRACDLALVTVGFARMNMVWSKTFSADDKRDAFLSRLRYICNKNADSLAISSDPKKSSDGQNTSFQALTSSNIAKVHKFDEKMLGDIIWSIGAMEAKWFDLPLDLKESISFLFEKKWASLNSFSLSSALWSLAKMGFKWSYFPPNLRASIPQRLLDLGPKMSPQQSSKIIWALGIMGVRYDEINRNNHDLFRFHLSNVASIKPSKMGSAVSASQILTGAAKLGAKWVDFTPAIQTDILSQCQRVMQSSNDRGITNCIWAMGTLGISIQDIPIPVRDVMLESTIKATENCNAWGLCNIVWGFAKMKMDWMKFSEEFRDKLMTNISRLEQSMNSVDICILLWSLGAMNTPLDLTPPFFKDVLSRILLKKLDDIKADELSKAVWGLSSCSLKWESLPYALHWKLNIALRRVGKHMSPQGVANCAYGIALLSFDNTKTNDAAFRGVHETLLNIIIQTRGDIFARRDGMDAYRKVRDEAKRRRVSNGENNKMYSDSMVIQEGEFDNLDSFENEMDAFYVQDIDTDAIFSIDEADLTETELKQAQEFEQLRIFAHYLDTMQFVEDEKSIPSELLAGSNNMIIDKGGSRLQNRVINGLKRGFAMHDMGIVENSETSTSSLLNPLPNLGEYFKNNNDPDYVISPEASSFEGVFPVDATIKKGGEVIAFIEVNGPTHYRHDGSLRRKDQLKETMYMKRHPYSSFYRIKWNDANKLGSDVIGEELADSILSSEKYTSPVTKTLQSIRNNIEDFFSWGLRNEE